MFDQSAASTRRLEDFLDVYVKHLSPKHRTDTNELIHYLREPLEGRRIIYFGMTFRGEPCGYCALMYYASERIGVFDFIVIAPTARGHGAYFAFADLIAEYLERRRIFADYLVAEVISDDGLSDPLTSPIAIVRLLRLQGFRRARIKYHAPDPSMVRSLGTCSASLMIAANQKRETIAAAELMKIADLVYFNHYFRWYGPLMEATAREKYEQALKEEHARLGQRASSHDPIILNGMKDTDVKLQPVSERHQTVLTIFLTASAAVGLIAAVSPGATTGWIVLGVAALILVGALFSRKLRRLFLRTFGQ
ncbi:hypothetical protein OF829_12665 [Sphingomonas sp. LB-2]|uniref:hypothetical protein n=1 Tax=Sphingomonas caeni TaxID=2984949 RepID=UPI002230F88F|nr:hypothetical protein [Sphingomonas caeni]MCW3848095.1 hypothetical protein [Sphingomonas caeni]